MKSRFLGSLLPLILAGAALAILFSLLQPNSAQAISERQDVVLEGNADPKTVITVTSGLDINTSLGETCLTDSPCTLRRAIVQARNLPANDRPVLIKFDLPEDVNEGYDSALGVWNLEIKAGTDPAVFRSLNGGQIIIDGATQPGGRADGPKIILVGPTTGNRDGLIVGENSSGSHNGNEIRGLGFQNFKVHLYLNSNDNLIEDNWFGLASDGQGAFIRNDNPQDGSGNSGIAVASGSADNLIQDNVFLGFDGVAIALRGDDNIFTNNLIGTLPDGTVPNKQTSASLICTTEDWLGGGGISMTGNRNRVIDNRIAGLRQEIFHLSTQPDAIWLEGSCSGCLVQNNQIGIDSLGVEVGVCGRAIYVTDCQGNQVISNTIAEPRNSGILMNGALYDANLLRGNLIRRNTNWSLVDGNAKTDSAILPYTGLPDPLEFFQPAMITTIDGLTVEGTSGLGSSCPECVIELFLDDTDSITEALQSMAVITATASGDWTATLPFALSQDQGLRTTSTTTHFNVIPNIKAGTTIGLSELYLANSDDPFTVFLPMTRK